MSDELKAIKKYYDEQYGARQKYMDEYYRRKNCPVYDRKAVSEAKKASHTNKHVDFFGNIISLKVGYVGQSITPSIDKDLDPATLEKAEDALKSFGLINAMDIVNSESISKSSISGLSHRLCYTKDGVFLVKNIDGWGVVYDPDQTDPDKAYYFYDVVDLVGKKTSHCDIYDKTTVTYHEQKDGAVFAQVGDSQAHNFQEVPIFPIINNDLQVSDCEDSVELMDLYDEIISDTGGEVKAMRLAYLMVWGDLYTGKDSNGNPIDINTWMKQASTMSFGGLEDGKKMGDAQFLEKNINDVVIQNMLSVLRTHIFETSGSLDLKEMASTERVFAAKAQMLRLENTAAVTERYMRAALYKQSRLLAYWMRTHDGINIDEKDISYTFKRTFPRDIEAEARTLALLSATIELEDALKVIGWDNYQDIAANASAEEDDLLRIAQTKKPEIVVNEI
jgi:SPP1 family phage portal protein